MQIYAMDVDAELESRVRLMLEDSEATLLASLAGDTFKHASPSDLVKRGAEIMLNLRTRLAPIICADSRIRNLHKAAKEEGTITVIVAVMDCIAGYITGISPLTVAVLIFRQGLDSLCCDKWKSDVSSE